MALISSAGLSERGRQYVQSAAADQRTIDDHSAPIVVDGLWFVLCRPDCGPSRPRVHGESQENALLDDSRVGKNRNSIPE